MLPQHLESESQSIVFNRLSLPILAVGMRAFDGSGSGETSFAAKDRSFEGDQERQGGECVRPDRHRAGKNVKRRVADESGHARAPRGNSNHRWGANDRLRFV
jgi:hypothetical protein